jgi:hypothetical protein
MVVNCVSGKPGHDHGVMESIRGPPDNAMRRESVEPFDWMEDADNPIDFRNVSHVMIKAFGGFIQTFGNFCDQQVRLRNDGAKTGIY